MKFMRQVWKAMHTRGKKTEAHFPTNWKNS